MKKTYIYWAVGILVFVGLPMGYWAYYMSQPGQYDTFAACLVEKNVTFYGAFWCPHCQAQKAMFGKSASKLPYVECSLPSGQGSTQECIDKEIKSYPVWEFADGSRLSGEQTFATLAEKSGCELP